MCLPARRPDLLPDAARRAPRHGRRVVGRRWVVRPDLGFRGACPRATRPRSQSQRERGAVTEAPRPTRLSAIPPPGDESEIPIHVLIADDEPALRKNLARILAARGMRVSTAENGEEGLALVEILRPDVALVDVMMPKLNGLEMLTRAKEKGLLSEFIMMTAHAGLEEAVSAVKAGAFHFLTKPFESNDAVAITVAQAAEHKKLVGRTRRLEQQLEAQQRFGELIGNSPQMLDVYRLIEGVATATSTVLILGESGTGKELVARAIHQRCARAGKPFVP